ncbi:MAG: PAS domain S-box protein [Chlorobiaceae bacterium]|nr:PAS domain S-box protein [Chlorobiaceae bacterium]
MQCSSSVSMLDYFPDAVVIINPDGSIVEANSIFSSRFGLHSRECPGKNVYDLMSALPDGAQIASGRRKKIDEVLRKGSWLSFEDERDGASWRHSVYPVCSHDGNISQLFVVAQDITALKLAERECKEINARFDFTIEKYNLGWLVIDLGNFSINRNSEHDRLFGYDTFHPGWTYELFLDHVLPEDRERLKHQFAESITKPGNWGIEYRIRRRDGEIRWLQEIGGFQMDEDGNATRLFIVMHDISDLKRAEEERDKLQEQLQQFQKMEMLGQLAGGIAHDFNNVLSVILGYTEMLLSEIDETHPFYESLASIEKMSSRSAGMVNQLLAFSRKQIAQPKILVFDEELGNLLPIFVRLIGENIEFHWEPGSKGGRVSIDPSQLYQIVTNLCVNARDAIEDAGKITIVTSTIHVNKSDCDRGHACRTPGQYVRLSISDTGSGIDKDTLPHIFEPYFTTKDVGKGTGLGLSTIYGILSQNSGYIDCHTQQGAGTTFSIYLPEFKSVTETGNIVPPGYRLNGNKETILVVDDDPQILQLITDILRKNGFMVFSAHDGEDATRIFMESGDRISLLLSDVLLPRMSGTQLSGNLQELNPNLRTIFMSGYAANAFSQNGLMDEDVHYITKPFTISSLLKLIENVLHADVAG